MAKDKTKARDETAAAKAAPDQTAGEATAGVASEKDNAKLKHSAGGSTTRDDTHDVGVPMLQGDKREPAGPEDALGRGQKRGDYRDRVPGQPHTSRALEDGGEPVTQWVDGDSGKPAKKGDKGAVEVVVGRKPLSEVVAQKPRTEDIGNDAPLLKGGVTTDPDIPAATAAVAR